MRTTLASVCLVLLANGPAATAAEAKPFTLRQVLSAPFASELTAAPAGDKLAWILNQSGVRNVWVAEGPDFRGRRLTSYAADDGQELVALAWAPDAKAVVYVRGGDPNRRGEIPNPKSDPAGAAHDFLLHSRWLQAYDAAAVFLDRHLAGKTN